MHGTLATLDLVSIHARTRRATPGRRQAPTPIRCFNPRPHTTGDVRCRLARWPCTSVSIHARTRRATDSPRTPQRRDHEFQSTPAHDGRPRSLNRRQSALRHVSIHARTRRATLPFLTYSNTTPYASPSANPPGSRFNRILKTEATRPKPFVDKMVSKTANPPGLSPSLEVRGSLFRAIFQRSHTCSRRLNAGQVCEHASQAINGPSGS